MNRKNLKKDNSGKEESETIAISNRINWKRTKLKRENLNKDNSEKETSEKDNSEKEKAGKRQVGKRKSEQGQFWTGKSEK